jgi:alkylation response protein AidB-like acyl-CoA dehydrogenase
MDFLPSVEQDEIVASAAAFLADTLPISRTRALIAEASNVDTAAWSAAAKLGWFALGLPQEAGGVGGGLADESLLFREIGRSMASGPFLATTLAARVAAAAGQPDLTDTITGGQQVALALPGQSAGEVYLLDASEAKLVLLATAEEALLLRIADLDGVSPVGCLDPTTRLSQATLGGARPVAAVAASADRVARRGMVLVAAMLAGLAEATRDIGAEHAKVRVQFDRPIGVNQAVKHPCADMAVHAELAWAQTVMAALAIDEAREDAEFQALSAKIVASDAAERNAAATIQILGGMGWTFEHDANLYARRAFVLGHVFGQTRDALSRLIELPAAL